MNGNTNNSNEIDTSPKGKTRTRAVKTIFPRVPLMNVISLVNEIYEQGQGQPVRRTFVFDKLGKSPSSSTSRDLVTASNTGYGLVKGNYNSEKLDLTNLGKSLMEAQTDYDRQSAIYDTLYLNEVFKRFAENYYDKNLPLDPIAIDFLSENFNLSQKDAELCYSVIKKNLEDYGLLQPLKTGKTSVNSRDEALKTFQKQQPIPEETQETHRVETSKETEITDVLQNKKKIYPQITFNIQVILPEQASPEIYDAIFSSIAKNLLPQ